MKQTVAKVALGILEYKIMGTICGINIGMAILNIALCVATHSPQGAAGWICSALGWGVAWMLSDD